MKGKSDSSLALVKRLVRESFRRHAMGYGLAIAAMAVGAAMTGATAWLMKYTTDEFMAGRNFESITWIAALVGTIFIVKGFATYFYSVTLSRVGNGIVAERQLATYEKVLDQGLAFYTSRTSADLITQVTQCAQAARAVLDTIVTSFARDALTLVSLLAVMIFQQPALTFVVVILGPIIFFLIHLILRRVRTVMTMEYQSISEIVNVMQETVLGARVVKSFHLERLMQGRMATAVSDVRKRSNMISALEAITHPMMETLAGLIIAAAILVSGFLVVHKGQTPGDIMAFITALLLSYEPAKRLARTRVSLEAGMVGVRMMYDLADTQLAIAERPDAQPLRRGPGRIEFDRVTFAYGEEPLMRELSLSFAPGRITALVGPSGGGKSTIFNLIMRLYDPLSGRVTIDGQDIRDVTLKSLREAIGYVGQETFLFGGTIMSNLRVAREGASEDAVIAAAKAANAHDFIMATAKGYDTEIGENGVRLSGGQRQRLSIARAILKDAPIMLFDEATSALDPSSEANFRDAMTAFSRDRTVLVIAHRLSTVRKADGIVVIDNGAAAEAGSHDALMGLGGTYRRLYDSQLL